MSRYIYILYCFLFSLLSWSQDCLESISIPSGSYELFDDYYNQLDEDIILLPIITTGQSDFAVSSYQFNLLFNHQLVNIDIESFGIINNSIFYNLYNLNPSVSNVSSGGAFSLNIIELNDSSSVLSVAYATSQAEPFNEKLLYIPLTVSNEECFYLSFSDGYINDQYVFPNQTYELLISNQDLSDCAVDGTICLSSGNSIDQCADIFACNYNPNSITDDDCSYLSEPIIDITQGTWEMNYYWSINDMDYISTYDFISNGTNLEGVLDPDWAAATGSSDSFYWSMCGPVFTMWYIQDLSINPYYNGDIVFVGTYCNGVITGTSSSYNGNTGTFTMTNSIITVINEDCDGSEVYGCTDSSAFNYNEDATNDDGSCISIVYGCTDEIACNYNSEANFDDDSCVFEADSCFVFVNNDCCCCGVCDCVCEQTIESPFICEGDLTGDYSTANIVIEGQIENCECAVNEVTGCIDISACNYDINATNDDGSCEYLSCVGCTDSSACNYDVNATDDDGSCVFEGESCYVVVGNDCCCCGLCLCVCEDFLDSMYTCEFLITGEDSNNIVIEGQLDNCECNINSDEGCVDESACNYDINATSDDGSCEYLSCVGCTDSSACNYDINAINDNGSCVFPNSCGDCQDFGITQSVDLPVGWSLFSTYICPFNPSFDVVLSDLVIDESLIILKDDGGNVYWPEFALNSIGDLENGKAYLAKLENNSSLEISGSLLNYDYPILLENGWSYIGYLHQDTYPIEDMFDAILPSIMIIKDTQGNVFWPLFDINGIETMSPGLGYQINLLDELTFSYPISSAGRFTNNFTNINNLESLEIINTGNNMTIGIPTEIWLSQPEVGDEVFVFDQSGLIVGKSKYRELGTVITIWGDDETTSMKDGLLIGEEFNIKLYRSNDLIFENVIVDQWDMGNGYYSIDGISIPGSISQTTFLTKKIIHITDVIGRTVNYNTKGTVLYIYNDGSVEKKYNIE